MCLVGSSRCTAALLKLILMTFPMSATDAVVEVAAGNDSLREVDVFPSTQSAALFALRLAREISCRCGWETASSGWMAAWGRGCHDFMTPSCGDLKMSCSHI